ncbi:MAG: response regulator [Desulfobulbaceae bacterium]|nr:response regulator [Desulfobulbaceae bacterium]
MNIRGLNLNKKITGGIFLVVIIFTLCQGLVMHSIISSTGEKEIKAMHKEEMIKTRQKLQNYVEIAYNMVESHYENSHNKQWLQKEYGLQLNKIINIAESIVAENIALVTEGTLSREAAQKRALHSISQLRYSADMGYVWINDVGKAFSRILIKPHSQEKPDETPVEVGMGYVWVNDMGKPFPRMLMHPTIPDLEGKILDDKRFNCALGIKKNLFVAMVNVAENGGEGFIDYIWPKPTKLGLTEEQPKLSYVRAIPEWNWIIGSGIYVDDARDKALKKSKQDLRKMRYNGGEGYFWINDESAPYPKMIMHPTMPELNGKVMDDPKFNVVLGEPKHLFKAIRLAAEEKGEGFVKYMWPKPTREGLTKEEPKLSFVRTFAPFGWVIGTGVYIDSIDRLIEEKISTIESTNFYLLLAILSVAVALFLFLTFASYFLIDRLFIQKINQANDDLQLEIEEKKTEKELIVARKNSEVANSAKSEFLANMSHEIRTPMNAVVGLAHLLKQTDLNYQQQDYLNKIALSADNLLAIINDILDFSKIEAGKLDLEKIPFDLRSDILQNVTQVVGLTAADKGLEMMLDIDPDLPDPYVGDPVRLRQILINLLNNAVKFTEKGHITLVVKKRDVQDESIQISFEVHDTGIGMNEAQLKGLFTAFSQADASTTRRFGGTGLGLTISKKLAEMMGGEIGAHSSEGEGSTFWFSARLLQDPGPGNREQPQLTDDIKDLRVLVVDNNETARLILTRQLEHFGYKVTEAESGEEAIFLLQTVSTEALFDLVLIDWMMPGMDGIETARYIQTGKGLAKIPALIMLTAFDKQKLLDSAQGLQLQEILTKPIFPSDLLNAILATFGKDVAKREGVDHESLPEHVLGARILLVEDILINQEVAREILVKAGVSVTIAGDGEKGLERLKLGDADGNPFDAVLMDIQMPVMDGYTAAREIRKLSEYQELPIIAMTANAFASDRQKALEVGMNDHVTKPINVRELFKVLGELIFLPEERRGRSVDKAETVSTERDLLRPADLPEIDGLDIASGVKRAADNLSLYESLLETFVLHHTDDIIKITEALEKNDILLAVRLAHTLKGVSGCLGAERLQLLSGTLEEAITKASGEKLQAALANVEHALAELLAGIRKAYPVQVAMEEPKGPHHQPETLDSASVRQVLDTLRDYLADDDPEAMDYFLEEKAQLSLALPAVNLREWDEKIRAFDFEAVIEDIDQAVEKELT